MYEGNNEMTTEEGKELGRMRKNGDGIRYKEDER